MVEVVLSHLPAGAGEATIQAWHFEEGDAVQKGDEIVELSTEEGALTITAPATGILAEVYYDEGESVERGEILCLIEDEESLEGAEGEEEEE
jgi:2-oxoglutarate dehydrogenase E2 component (dihydrolipoamide succinyltransferase)